MAKNWRRVIDTPVKIGNRKHAAGLLINMRDERLTPDDPEFESKFAHLKEILSSADELDENTLITSIEATFSDLDARPCRRTIGEYLNTLTEREKIARAVLNIATHSEDKNIKSLAVACLGYLQYTNAIQMISDLAVLEEYNLFAREALGNIGTKESGEAILKHLEHARDDTKISIVEALIKIGHPDFIKPLLKYHVSNCVFQEGYIALPIANFVGLEKYLSADVSDESYRGAVEILYALVSDVLGGGPDGNFFDYHNPPLLIQNFVESTKSIKPRWWMVITGLRIITLLKRVPKGAQARIDEATFLYGEEGISKVSYYKHHLEKVKACLPYLDALTEYAESPSSLETLVEGLSKCAYALNVLPITKSASVFRKFQEEHPTDEYCNEAMQLFGDSDTIKNLMKRFVNEFSPETEVGEWEEPIHINHSPVYEYAKLLAKMLSLKQTEQSRRILLHATESPNSTVQAIALNAIANLDTQTLDDQFRQAIIANLSSVHADVAADAARSAGNHRLHEAVPKIIEIVEQRKWRNFFKGREFIRALGRIRDERAIIPLKRYLECELQKEYPASALEAHIAITEIERK